MPIEQLDVEVREDPLPDDVEMFIRDANRRIEQFVHGRLDEPIPGFVPCDFRRVFEGLRALSEQHLAPGPSFLEWGSGFGVVACMAAELDFHACGIEINAALVDQSERLAEDHGVSVEFVCGSYVPVGGEDLVDELEDFTWIESGGMDGYGLLGLDPDDFDVVFAYPWPGEERLVHDLFEEYASPGALLMTFNGVEDLRFRRKLRG